MGQFELRRRRQPAAAVCVLSALLAFAAQSRAAGTEGFNDRRTYSRDYDESDVPTGARRAAEWHPSNEGLSTDPWSVGGSVGIAWFTGDSALDGNPGFAGELHVAKGIASDFYVVGSYMLAVAQTEVTDPASGSTDRDSHVLHIPTIGIGYRAEVTPEIHLFIEPRIGGLFGDADAAPAGGASAGIDIDIRPGFAVRAGFTGLFTHSRIDTPAGNADLNGIWSVGVGLVFEF